MSDLDQFWKQLKRVTVTMSSAEVFAIVCLMQIADEVPRNTIGQTTAAREALTLLRSALPPVLRTCADKAARRARDELSKPIRERLMAAAIAAGEARN